MGTLFAASLWFCRGRDAVSNGNTPSSVEQRRLYFQLKSATRQYFEDCITRSSTVGKKDAKASDE